MVFIYIMQKSRLEPYDAYKATIKLQLSPPLISYDKNPYILNTCTKNESLFRLNDSRPYVADRVNMTHGDNSTIEFDANGYTPTGPIPKVPVVIGTSRRHVPQMCFCYSNSLDSK